MFKLFLGMPVYKGSAEPECLHSIYSKIFIPNNTYTIAAKDFCQFRGSPNIYMQRYNLALAFLASDCDYFLYFDADQVLHAPINPIEMLILDDKDIISPLIVRKFFPHIPTAITLERRRQMLSKDYAYPLEDFRKYPQDKPYKVHYSCGGVVLIKRKILEAVNNPFLPVFDADRKLMSTDYSFYKKAKDNGAECWIEPRLLVSHIGKYDFLPSDYYALIDSGRVKIKHNKAGSTYVME